MSISGNNSIGPNLLGYADKLSTSSGTKEIGVGSEAVPGNPAVKRESRESIEKELENLNKFLQSGSTHLKFTLHEKLNEYYVQVLDGNNKVVREIPSKKIMDMVANMYETLGIIVDEKR
ncbi:flagellar protein FlaG [Brevibacillus porteri]|uniref:Flagellar protein FlaG n=1 Tax=Brevibacillus porteri TaxID=2126350 RepID=A0ABX5FP40_9BACL|nr:flagellar protein FlaG [Brevibacillus porteri]MED1801460.1 flagellar protein FlaG [Brevibacillus porteri]MED2133837.1 flagellar protein FlaG [Brevibacillus porteri]MED2748243.1 flagellar protein FlaG [Brevibacillus porteri]MED2815381.1 flagellar protein FlaG [Brevibacillus porteri]MED2894812.1 flagellar protein FlaG [Brevibacillus porteri]